jgi:predicted ester cyclase
VSAADANRKAVERFVNEVQNEKRVELMEELCTPDLETHHPGAPQPGHGIAEAQRMLRQTFHEFPDIHWTLDEVVGDGDKVATRFSVRAVNSGPLRGFNKPTNKTWTGTGLVVYELRDGKIAVTKIQEDLLEMVHQLGVVPKSARMLFWTVGTVS